MKNVLVAFWSQYHGQTCTTSNALLSAVYFGLSCSMKTLLLHNSVTKSNLENAFFPSVEENITFFDETGIDALMKLAKTGQLCPQAFKDYTRTLMPERLDVLTGTNKTSAADVGVFSNMIQYLLNCAKQSYDLVICDATSGSSDITRKSLEVADIIVVNLNQNLEVLRTYFEKKEWLQVLEKKQILFVLGNYEEKSRYNKAEIKKMFNCEGEIYTVPRSLRYMEAHNSNTVLDYMHSTYNNFNSTEHEESAFMQEINNLCIRILELARIDIESVYSPIEKPTVFDSILKVLKIK